MGTVTSCIGKSAPAAHSRSSSNGWASHRPTTAAASPVIAKLDSADTAVHVDSYAARMHIDDDVLAERYRHRMTNVERRGPAAASRRSSSGRGGGSASRGVVTFRAESFDSRASTDSEKLAFIMRLIESLPESFLDERTGGQAEDAEEPGSTSDSPVVFRVSAQVNQSADSCQEDGLRSDAPAPLAKADSKGF